MKRNTLFAVAAALSVFTTAGAFAQEATQDFPVAGASSGVSREQVRAELREARAAGERSFTEASPAPVPQSTAMRAQVREEAIAAHRGGAPRWDEAGSAS